MARLLKFQFIADNRFEDQWLDDGYNYINELDKKLKNKISQHKQLELIDMKPREIKFTDNKQIRKEYYIKKQGRTLTWNDVYKIINSIKPVPYDFEKSNHDIKNGELVVSL